MFSKRVVHHMTDADWFRAWQISCVITLRKHENAGWKRFRPRCKLTFMLTSNSFKSFEMFASICVMKIQQCDYYQENILLFTWSQAQMWFSNILLKRFYWQCQDQNLKTRRAFPQLQLWSQVESLAIEFTWTCDHS